MKIIRVICLVVFPFTVVAQGTPGTCDSDCVLMLRGAIEWIAEETGATIGQIVLDSTYSGRGISGGPVAPQAVFEQLANAIGFERSTLAAAMECDAVIRITHLSGM
jgi:hypothetical protein